MIHNTFVIERKYPAKLERVFAAFTDPGKKRRWFAEGAHHEVEAFECDARVGGAERVRYRLKEGTPFPGVAIETDGTHQDIVPNQRIVITSTMTFAGNRISTALVTFHFTDNGNDGTRLTCTHQAVFYEGADGPQMREAGWQALLSSLEKELAA